MFCSARGPTHRPPAHLIYPDWRCRARSKAATSNSGFKIGDAVCALVAGGGYAEYCVAPVAQCLPKPHTLSFAEAAGLPETYFTVWSNVFDRARLAPGESLLVQGGSSGIGVAAIQLAAALGKPFTQQPAVMRNARRASSSAPNARSTIEPRISSRC